MRYSSDSNRFLFFFSYFCCFFSIQFEYESFSLSNLFELFLTCSSSDSSSFTFATYFSGGLLDRKPCKIKLESIFCALFPPLGAAFAGDSIGEISLGESTMFLMLSFMSSLNPMVLQLLVNLLTPQPGCAPFQ